MTYYKHIVAAAASTLILTACGGGGSGSEITSTPLAPLPAPTTPSVAPRTGDFASLQLCMTSRWILLADQVRSTLLSSLGAVPGLGVTVVGQGVVDFSGDGTYKYAPNFSMVLTMQGESGPGQWSGVLTGTWTIVGDVLTMTQVANSITGTYSIFGQTLPLPLPSFGGTAQVIECTQQTLKYQVPGGTGPVTQTLVLG